MNLIIIPKLVLYLGICNSEKEFDEIIREIFGKKIEYFSLEVDYSKFDLETTSFFLSHGIDTGQKVKSHNCLFTLGDKNNEIIYGIINSEIHTTEDKGIFEFVLIGHHTFVDIMSEYLKDKVMKRVIKMEELTREQMRSGENPIYKNFLYFQYNDSFSPYNLYICSKSKEHLDEMIEKTYKIGKES